MILFFSGTGNSRFVANHLAEMLNERLVNMECAPAVQLEDGEALGIIFPVYAWGLPQIVEQYLRGQLVGSRYVWCVMTCGDDMGQADRCLAKVLGRKADAVFSVSMPNTYVCLPGFDVDSDALAQKKVDATLQQLPTIAECVGRRKGALQVHRGAMPWTKTYVLGPLFDKWLVTDKKFRTTAECNACGLCARQCPRHDISLADGRPRWQHADCTGCLRCFHKCPKRAIEWGGFTTGKKQVQRLP